MRDPVESVGIANLLRNTAHEELHWSDIRRIVEVLCIRKRIRISSSPIVHHLHPFRKCPPDSSGCEAQAQRRHWAYQSCCREWRKGRWPVPPGQAAPMHDTFQNKMYAKLFLGLGETLLIFSIDDENDAIDLGKILLPEFSS